MHNPDPQLDAAPLVARWRRLRAAYRLANTASHHVLGFALKLVLAVYFLLAVLFLVLRYAILPNIGLYKGDIETAASRILGSRVTIAAIAASWEGLRPALSLGDVRLHDAKGRQLLALPSVDATFGWWSVAAFEPRFSTLEIKGAHLAARRGTDGVVEVAGFRLDPTREGGGGADWLLRQRDIVVRDARIEWTDELRGMPTLALDHVTLALLSRWGVHHVALRATPPAALGQPIDVRAQVRHGVGARPSDMSRWKGELYLDLRGVDLAAWKRHLDYPIQFTRGRGSVRAWIDFDQARLAGFTADLALADVSARLGPDIAPLELARVTGRLRASEALLPGKGDGKPTFGAHGHTISLDRFEVLAHDGRTLPPATLEETWRPARGGKPEHTSVRARNLDVGALAALAQYLPITPLQRQLLADFAPRGVLRDVQAEWEGPYSQITQWRLAGEVSKLALNAQQARQAQPAANGLPARPARPATPGFENLSGTIDAHQDGGKVRIASDHMALFMPAWFASARMPFDTLQLEARWTREAGRALTVEVEELKLRQGAFEAQLSGRHELPLTPGGGPGVADFRGTFDGFAVDQIRHYLPLSTPHGLHDWLVGALQGGRVVDGSVRLAGDLSHFPFNAAQREAAQAGEFRVAGRLENARLEYAPAQRHAERGPLWPLAEAIQGKIEFNRARMDIQADRARSHGVVLHNVRAVIPDLGAHEQMMLEIDGQAQGTLAQLLGYVSSSPVLGWIGNFTEETRASGPARLSLSMAMPLSHMLDTKVTGSLHLQGNDVSLFPELPVLQGAQGRIDFHERGFALSGVQASFLGAPLAVTGGSQREGGIVVRMDGMLSADGMRRTAPYPALRRLAEKLSGETRYTGAVVVANGQRHIWVDSSLAGLAMNLPAPLAKAQNEVLPLQFRLTGQPAQAGSSRDEIGVELGQALAAHYVRTRQGRAPWQVVRGGIGVNVPAPRPESGLTLQADVAALNADQWIAAGRAIAGVEEGGAGGAEAGGFAQYVLPTALAGRVGQLTLGERRLADVVLGATHEGQVWRANVQSRHASGYLTWAETPSGLGKVTARLASLVIPASAANEVRDLLESPTTSATIPSLDIVAEQFELFDKRLGRLELKASNVRALAGREWRIDQLVLDSPDGKLQAHGRWLSKDGRNNTSLNFGLDIHDAGRLLGRLGFPDTLKRGKGKLSGDIAWSGLPYAMDLPSLSGQIDMQVESGQFLKQDPGAAKLLGILSLQALPRLLKFEFQDIFSEGLAFDGISANALIERGVLRTDNLKMHGVAATVLMNGTADIANETTNLRVVVIPEFNLGTGPLVYGLAVNPVVGLTSFLAQLFLRAPVMKALTYQMQVSGPWKSPAIVRIENPAAAGSAPAAPQPPRKN